MEFRAITKYLDIRSCRPIRKHALPSVLSHFLFPNDFYHMIPSGIKTASNRIFNPTRENRNIFFAFGFIFGT